MAGSLSPIVNRFPVLESVVTNARFASLHGLPVVPVPLSTTPVPLLKPRARHELAWCKGRRSGGLPSVARQRALRSGSVSLCASLRLCSTVPAHRPQTEADFISTMTGSALIRGIA